MDCRLHVLKYENKHNLALIHETQKVTFILLYNAVPFQNAQYVFTIDRVIGRGVAKLEVFGTDSVIRIDTL